MKSMNDITNHQFIVNYWLNPLWITTFSIVDWLNNISVGASVAQWYRAGLLVNSSSDQSCTRDMIHNKFNLISPGCPRPSIALNCRIVKYHSSFIVLHHWQISYWHSDWFHCDWRVIAFRIMVQWYISQWIIRHWFAIDWFNIQWLMGIVINIYFI